MAKSNSDETVTRGMLDEAVDTLLEGMDKLYEMFKGEMNSRFDKVENRLRSVENGISHLKDDIEGLKADLSDTPSRSEFNELRSRVNKHHPL